MTYRGACFFGRLAAFAWAKAALETSERASSPSPITTAHRVKRRKLPVSGFIRRLVDGTVGSTISARHGEKKAARRQCYGDPRGPLAGPSTRRCGRTPPLRMHRIQRQEPGTPHEECRVAGFDDRAAISFSRLA